MTTATELALVPGMAPVGSETWAAALRAATREAFQKTENEYVRLARLLRVVGQARVGNDPQGAPIYTLWGYSTFQEWAEADLGIHPHRARSLRAIAECVDEHLAATPEADRDGLYKLGFSKLRVLRRVLTPANAAQWLGVAGVTSVATLEGMVQSSVTATVHQLPVNGKVPAHPDAMADDIPDADVEVLPYAPADPVKVTVRRYHLYPNQVAMVDAALTRAKEVTCSDKLGHNLTVMAQLFLADTPFETPTQSRAIFFKTLAEACGLRITITDPVTGEVILEALP